MPPRWPEALWILRHGESAGNVARDEARAAGLERIAIDAPRGMDVPLSKLGEEQAAAVGHWIREGSGRQRPTIALTSSREETVS